MRSRPAHGLGALIALLAFAILACTTESDRLRVDAPTLDAACHAASAGGRPENYREIVEEYLRQRSYSDAVMGLLQIGEPEAWFYYENHRLDQAGSRVEIPLCRTPNEMLLGARPPLGARDLNWAWRCLVGPSGLGYGESRPLGEESDHVATAYYYIEAGRVSFVECSVSVEANSTADHAKASAPIDQFRVTLVRQDHPRDARLALSSSQVTRVLPGRYKVEFRLRGKPSDEPRIITALLKPGKAYKADAIRRYRSSSADYVKQVISTEWEYRVFFEEVDG